MTKHPTKGQRATKHAAILDAAADLFILHGYDGASTEMIAEKAGVSRQTIYNQFENKEALFHAITDSMVQEFIEELGRSVEQSEGVRDALLAFGRRMLDIIIRPRTLGLCRLVTTEVPRFPELGRVVYEKGILRTEKELASYLKSRNELQIADPLMAARQFMALAANPIEFKARLGIEVDMQGPEVAQHLEAAVDTFLKAFEAGR